MAQAYKLTWRERERRWRKFYRGKYYYFPAMKGETKLDSYKRCWEEWIKERAKVDLGVSSPHEKAWEVIAERCRVRMQELEKEDTEENREEWLTYYRYLVGAKRNIEYGIPWFEGMDPHTFPISRFFGVNVVPYEDDPPPWKRVEEGEADNSIRGSVKRFLEEKRREAERGERSKSRYDILRICLDDFMEFCGPERPVSSITGGLLCRYRDNLQEKADRQTASRQADQAGRQEVGRQTGGRQQADRQAGRPAGFSHQYAKERFGIAKQFIRWAWERDLLELPRIISNRNYGIRAEAKPIEVFTLEEVRQLLQASDGMLRLAFLLMLNTGMTQADIAGLRRGEVDWEQGRISRKRSKTKNHENVPQVSYPLWEETFRLLVKYRNDGRKGNPELALVNRDGGSLKTEVIRDGKVRKSDCLKSAYDRLLRKLGIWGRHKQMKSLRKTGASLLGSHAEFGRYAQHFLGHSPRTIADKHYVRPSQDAFDRAVAWLGEQFGVGVVTTKTDG